MNPDELARIDLAYGDARFRALEAERAVAAAKAEAEDAHAKCEKAQREMDAAIKSALGGSSGSREAIAAYGDALAMLDWRKQRLRSATAAHERAVAEEKRDGDVLFKARRAVLRDQIGE